MRIQLLLLAGLIGIGHAEVVKLTGTFQPYESQDKSVTNSVVMKPLPKCGKCHAWATMTSEAPRLELFVAHGKTTNSWVIPGRLSGQQVIFDEGKLRLTNSAAGVTGLYLGRMHARIELNND
jgi:hypothetical protein